MFQHLRHVLSDLLHIGLYIPARCYNDNHSCVDWSKYLTKNGMKQISLFNNYIREYVHPKEIETLHIYGKLNLS